MRHFAAMGIALSLAVGMVGCDTKTEVKEEKTVTTPGGETTTTESTTVEKSGENPPPAETPNP